MKSLIILVTLILSIPLLAQKPKYPECGGDYNCFYEKEAQAEKMEKAEENEYRNERMQVEERQLEEVEGQSEILDQQLELQQEESEAATQEEPIP
jgi:hypothetical protein